MTRKKQQGDAGKPGPAAFSPVPMPDFRRAVSVGAMAPAKLMERTIRMNQSYLQFLSNRLEHDRALMTELAGLDDPAEVLSVWSEFYQTAQREYAEQAMQLASMLADDARAATADAQQVAETFALGTGDARPGADDETA